MDWQSILLENWHVKFVAITLVVAAIIDGRELRVPNWITFPMVLTGIIYNTSIAGLDGFGMAMWGMTVGLLTLLPLWMVGGMGAGDVKLMAGIGAWLGATVTWHVFLVTCIVGAVMAIAMVAWKRDWDKHYGNFLIIASEWMTVRSVEKLAENAAERKPRMLLLPYGIPICVAALGYFAYQGMFTNG